MHFTWYHFQIHVFINKSSGSERSYPDMHISVKVLLKVQLQFIHDDRKRWHMADTECFMLLKGSEM